MNVLMLTWEFPPRKVGGLAVHVYNISREFVKKGLGVYVVTCDFPETPEHEIFDGIGVYRFPSFEYSSPDFITWALAMQNTMKKAAAKVLQKNKIDIIHSHDWLSALAGISLKHAFRLPLIGTIHSTESGRRGGLWDDGQRMIHHCEGLLTFEAWRVICCSEYMADQIVSLFSVPRDKISIIPNGVIAQKFVLKKQISNKELREFRSKFADPDERIVMFVGRLVPEKGTNVLIGAVPIILKTIPNANFVIVGDGWMKNNFMKIAWDLRVNHKTIFTGYISDEDLQKLYQVADVAVFPSLYEPFGIAALEAMSAGIPTIVSDTGGLSEIVDQNVNGVKVPPNNSIELAKGIIKVLSDSDFADSLRSNAIKKLKEVYDWDRIADQTIDVYKQVLKEYDTTSWGKERLKARN